MSNIFIMMNNVQDYKQIVHDYCNRIVNEKRMSIEQNYQNGQLMYTIKFHQPEWFTELDDDLKHNIVLSIQNHYMQLINDFINTDNQKNDFSRKRKHQEICSSNHCNCDSDSD